ncbi:MAG: HEAT repeat domain-containing protein [Verrucomicrobiota bacterium]
MFLRKLSLVALTLLAGVALNSCDKPAQPAKPAAPAAAASTAVIPPEDEVHAQYAGSKTCVECHAGEFEKWHPSNHGQAERDISPQQDNPFFSPKRTHTEGDKTTDLFVDADGLAKILTEGLDKKRHTYQPVRVIGNDPLRQFLIPAPGGRLQTCDISLDPIKNEWFDVYSGDPREPGDWGHWTGQGMNWNAMCATCHNTRLRKNYEPRSNSYRTTMAEMSVSCESCHGPMKKHVEWQKNPPKEAAKDPTLKKLTRDQITETCAACHARRAELTGDPVPGESFFDHHSLTLTDETDTFYPDGQVRGENYEYTSFVASKMHHAGVRCMDCHDPHTNKLVSPGNQLCMNCHAGGREDFPTAPIISPADHSHHGVDSTGNQCISCHMPVTTYMQRDPRHDHGFTIPDPKLTQEFGVPNACNRCHTDKDAAWAVSAMKNFYGEKPDSPARARALLVARARQGNPAARDGLVALLASEPIAAWRGSAIHLLRRWVREPAVNSALVKRLSDDSPLVREAAVRALGEAVQNAADASLADAIRPLLDDPIRAVRIAAAWALCESLDLSSKAGRELIHMLDHNADQPTGRMQLGQFAMRRGDSAGAIRQIRKAIEWDPNSPPFHHDLAILLSSAGDMKGATESLRKAIALDAANPEYHFKLALSLNETGDKPGTIAALRETVSLDPSYSRAWYNLGLALSQNQPQEAIAALRRGEKADPNDPTIPYARATIHAQLGEKADAQAAAVQALQIRRDYPEAMQLLRALSR